MPRPFKTLSMPVVMTLAIPLLAACGGGSAPPPPPAPTGIATTTGAPASSLVDPAAVYCSRVGGIVTPRTIGGRRADICRLPDGRSVSTASLLNSHNDL